MTERQTTEPVWFLPTGFAGHTHERTQRDSRTDRQTGRYSDRQADTYTVRHSRVYKANMIKRRTNWRTCGCIDGLTLNTLHWITLH